MHHYEFRKLSTIPPLVELEAEELTRITLQSNLESSTNVSLISIYLSEGSRMGILSVDTFLHDAQGSRLDSSPISLTYLDGSFLILRSSGVQELQVEVGERIASLAGAGRTILGVRSSEGMNQVDCIQGSCTYEKGKDEIVSFLSRAKSDNLAITGCTNKTNTTAG